MMGMAKEDFFVEFFDHAWRREYLTTQLKNLYIKKVTYTNWDEEEFPQTF